MTDRPDQTAVRLGACSDFRSGSAAGASLCSAFPATRHPLYTELTLAADTESTAGDIQWNFERLRSGGSREPTGRTEPVDRRRQLVGAFPSATSAA
jgi:hypothetical protein